MITLIYAIAYLAATVVAGCLWGLIPFFLGRYRYRPNMGRWGFIWCGVAGPFMLSFLVAVGFVVAILTSERDMRPRPSGASGGGDSGLPGRRSPAPAAGGSHRSGADLPRRAFEGADLPHKPGGRHVRPGRRLHRALPVQHSRRQPPPLRAPLAAGCPRAGGSEFRLRHLFGRRPAAAAQLSHPCGTGQPLLPGFPLQSFSAHDALKNNNNITGGTSHGD